MSFWKNLSQNMPPDWPVFLGLYGKLIVEILGISFMFYMILLLIQGTRTAQIVKGLGVIVVIFFLVRKFQLESIDWLLTKLFAFSVIAFIIIFQNDLRRALAKLGQNPLFGRSLRSKKWIEEIVKAMVLLSKKNIGALVVIERNIGLKNFIETGVGLDSKICRELLVTIFMSHTPLHDGAVIVRDEKFAAALCILPLSQSPYLSRTVGTRHRAALGISEETDAVAVTVSEETGAISIMSSGQITRDLDEKSLRESLQKLVQ